MFQRCREVGINFFDCANSYAGGRSEEILGKLVAGHRDELILTSKVYFPVGEDVNAGGATRKHILRSSRNQPEAPANRLPGCVFHPPL